ncbi:MAG: putative porin [Bacteroidota bacterium]|nr:putative porin [Bacteroidota bacterium]
MHDTVYFVRMENEFSWSNISYDARPDDKPVYLKFSIKQQNVQVGNDSEKFTFNQLIPSGQVSFFILKSFRLNTAYEFVIGDYNGGDFQLSANINQYIGTKYKNKGLITLRARYAQVTPPWMYNFYQGDIFKWDNSLARQEYLIWQADYNYKSLNIGGKYSLVKNYAYFDTLARPAQFGESFSVIQAFVNKNFQLGKFGIDNNVILQISSKEELLPLPNIIAHLNIDFTQPLFRNATTIQPGIELFYNTAYNGYGYMPVTRTFYLQDAIQTGNYIYADVYLKARIKRVRMYIKYRHFNAGMLSYDYFMVPNYPMRDATFNFGISWMFYD